MHTFLVEHPAELSVELPKLKADGDHVGSAKGVHGQRVHLLTFSAMLHRLCPLCFEFLLCFCAGPGTFERLENTRPLVCSMALVCREFVAEYPERGKYLSVRIAVSTGGARMDGWKAAWYVGPDMEKVAEDQRRGISKQR